MSKDQASRGGFVLGVTPDATAQKAQTAAAAAEGCAVGTMLDSIGCLSNYIYKLRIGGSLYTLTSTNTDWTQPNPAWTVFHRAANHTWEMGNTTGN